MTANIYKNEITIETEDKIKKATELNLITIENKTSHYVVFGAENVICSITGIK